VSDPNATWDMAFSSSASYTYAGVTGHLATITSQEENDFVSSLTGGKSIWIAAEHTFISGHRQFIWMTGAEVNQVITDCASYPCTNISYANWDTNPTVNPDNYGEPYVAMIGDQEYGASHIGKWHDLYGWRRTSGYVVEFDNANNRWVNTTKPLVSGARTIGSTLTAADPTWTPKASFTYQWMRDGSPILNATSSSYVLNLDDVFSKITLQIRGTSGSLDAHSETSDPVQVDEASPVPLPGSTCLTPLIYKSGWRSSVMQPGIAGSGIYGSSLTGSTGSWPSKVSFCYFWYANGQPIPGATSKNLKLTNLNGARDLRFGVVGYDKLGNASLRFSEPFTVRNAQFSTSSLATIAGAPTFGTIQKGIYKPWSKIATYSYIWKRNDVAIAGANNINYQPQLADIGQRISLSVCSHAEYYDDFCLNTDNAPVIRAGAFNPPPKITIQSNSSKVGSQLNAIVLLAPTNAGIDLQWLRDGQMIQGAKSPLYTVTEADRGHSITVTLTVTKSGYSDYVRTSAAKKIL